jgi:hypothetical protein
LKAIFFDIGGTSPPGAIRRGWTMLLKHRLHCRVAVCALLVAGALALGGGPVVAQQAGASSAGERTTNTAILNKIYTSGNARLARGDVAGAASAFQTVSEIAPELANTSYSLAVAMMLSDFSKRDRAQLPIGRALTIDPNNPLAGVVQIFVDPLSSQLRADGSLYIAAAAAPKLRAASQQVASIAAARNARYLAAFLNSAESTGDAAFPLRFVNFNRMTGQGGKLRLASWNEDLIVGQLFMVTVPEQQFAAYEGRLIARFQDGLNSLSTENQNLARMRNRLQQLRQQLSSDDPSQRLVVLANIDKVLSDLDDLIVRNETTIASLKVITDNLTIDQEVASKREELKKQEAELAKVRQIDQVLRADLDKRKSELGQVEAERIKKIGEVNKVQKQLNAAESKLAKFESELAKRESNLAQQQQTVDRRGNELAELKAREELLKQQQKAAEQLEAAKRQQADAADQLAKLKGDVAAAEQSKSGRLQELRQQQAQMEAEQQKLRAQIEQGEKARQQADQVKQELATLQGKKGLLEQDMRAEQEKLARVRNEREKLMAEVDAIRGQQEKAMAERREKAKVLNEVDFGRYYALVIGNNDYKQWPKLKTAVSDSKSVAEILKSKYGFEVTLLNNATRSDILNAFDDYIDKMTPRDNLVIFYAGHGMIDRAGAGYWVPVDGDAYVEGKTLRVSSMVRNEDILGALQKLEAKQVMVIADSCFAGGLTNAIGPAAGTMADSRGPGRPIQTAMRGAAPQDAAPQGALPTMRGFRPVVEASAGSAVAAVTGTVVTADSSEELIALSHWASKPARVVLTSGGNEPVIDQLKATDQHSVFANALLRALNKNDGVLKSIELALAVQDDVVKGAGKRLAGQAAPQTPSTNAILGYNGEFLFVNKKPL